jgi:2-polyprenyl-6-methoxyphenol hydroxylase-like FAD-dependent oxidoreductase
MTLLPESKRVIQTPVLIVGGGPVGLTLALDLAWRGIAVIVAELRHAGEPPSVKCNQLSARSMEIFRRLGIAKTIRSLGLPAAYANHVVSCIAVTGAELSRLRIPARGERFTAVESVEGGDTWWPTPEAPHRINQTYLEPFLFAHAAAQPCIRILNRTEVESYTQDEDGVTALARNLDTGEVQSIRCQYLAGCDGASSIVRKTMGANFQGTASIQYVQSTCIRAPDLIERLPGRPAWLYFALNAKRCGSMIAIDGRETWIIHNWLYHGETDFDAVDRDWAIRTILGVGADFRYDVVSKEDWIGRRLVADRFHDRRVFIAGDAAHLWISTGGYGMNAGIADAANLAWLLAAAVNGWAPPAILNAYQAERQPLTEQASRLIMDVSLKVMQQRREITADLEAPGPAGDALRARVGREAYALDIQQQCCGGLNFGYYYDQSPLIAYDNEAPPAYTMGSFTSSTVPGCRAPHLWLSRRRSLYDALGPDYTLIRTDTSVGIDSLLQAAAQHGVPLAVLDVATPQARDTYRHKLTLVRPDQHVAWRGDAVPTTPLALIDRVRGAI